MKWKGQPLQGGVAKSISKTILWDTSGKEYAGDRGQVKKLIGRDRDKGGGETGWGEEKYRASRHEKTKAAG